ncbi:MAG: hypothetical protein Q8L37_07215 [Candidatus Gottesmanbacteria bacterium]|nr:hypothetical protein [Candidatus Gottesmanbacteria bacterium]
MTKQTTEPTANDVEIMERIKKYDAIRKTEGEPRDPPMRVNIDKKLFTRDEMEWRVLKAKI